ncbi:MAG: hypothetical protein ACOYXR_07265 [Nitrospirota bacterium]
MSLRLTAALLVLLLASAPRQADATSFNPYPVDGVDNGPPVGIQIRLRVVQIQIFHDHGDQLPDGRAIGSGTGLGRDGVLVRRAELGVAGGAPLGARYLVVADLVASPVLRDAFIEIGAEPKFQLRVGQFRLPFGLETQLPPYKLPAINRMLMTFPGEQPDEVPGLLQEWDRGLALLGEPISGPLNVSYALAVVNGTGPNAPDSNDGKDLVGRVGLRLAGYQLGTSWYRGRAPNLAGLDRPRTRVGWDLEIHPNPLNALLIRGELIHGRDDATAFRGWYLLATYAVTDHWVPLIRIERLDPDRTVAADTLGRTTLGLTYTHSEQLAVSANYEYRRAPALPGVDNLAVVQIQISF